MWMIKLPHGPTAHFKLTSVVLPKRIAGHGRPTAHRPELILNHFSTRLGHRLGRMLATLFPHDPQFKGRQARRSARPTRAGPLAFVLAAKAEATRVGSGDTWRAAPTRGGRSQVVTMHNQRDFVFLRHHRYVFDDKTGKGDVSARLQVTRAADALSCWRAGCELTVVWHLRGGRRSSDRG